MNPAITVVLVVGNYRDRAQRVLRSVLAQDIANQILILFYDRADRPARDFSELNHPNVKYEAVDRNLSLGELQKRGILAATSEIVGLVEEHVAVPPNWARESLRLHAEGYAGVTGVFVPGNRQHRVSKLSFLITYGSYILPQTSGETNHIPADNSTLVRSKVLRYKNDLALLLDTDTNNSLSIFLRSSSCTWHQELGSRPASFLVTETVDCNLQNAKPTWRAWNRSQGRRHPFA